MAEEGLVDRLLRGPIGAAIQPEKVEAVKKLLDSISETASSLLAL